MHAGAAPDLIRVIIAPLARSLFRQDNSGAAANEFWAGEAQWAPSWASGSPFIIDSVSVWQTPGTGDFFYRPMP